MKTERLCNECKLFKPKLIKNCSQYEVNIPDMNIAKKCKYFTLKAKRKRCNKCKYIIYDKTPKKRSYSYRCSKLNINVNYLTLRYCNLFKCKDTKTEIK